MKPVFKCDYCKFMGTEEEVREHESICVYNYDKRSCHTCEHKKIESKNGKTVYKCKVGVDIPEGRMYEFCKSYERRPSSDYFTNFFKDLF